MVAEPDGVTPVVDLRWLAEKVGRLDRIPSNRDLGLTGRRKGNGPLKDRAREIDSARLWRMELHAQFVMELRREFGLRAEEAMKFQHEYATREAGRIRLADSWCKGGREREIPVTTDRQRELLGRVGRFQQSQPMNRHGHRSMIPSHRRYDSYYREFNAARHAADLPGHGLRHACAQERFEQIAGVPPPHAGGPKFSELARDGQFRWEKAARTVNAELGHRRGR